MKDTYFWYVGVEMPDVNNIETVPWDSSSEGWREIPNNLESYDLIDYIQNDEENISTINKRSLSYIGKAHECNLVNKYRSRQATSTITTNDYG